MKRIAFLGLILVASSLGFVGCGQTSTVKTEKKVTAPGGTTTTTTTQEVKKTGDNPPPANP